ncbi:MAG: hypothetical protein IKA51_05730 [Clostridia bacterium]|nr:hypothetical protein [Clostridia bacterium]
MFKKKWFRFAIMVIVICAVVFMVMNGAGFLSDKMLTVRPERTVSAEYIDSTGYFLKDEVTVSAKGDYTLSYEVNDGERVRVDTVVAELYGKGADLSAVSKLAQLSSRIESLEAINKGDLSYKQDALRLESEINALMLEMTLAAQTGALEGFSESADLLVHYFNIRQILLNEVDNFDGKLTALKSELKALGEVCPSPEGKVKAGAIGYFTTAFDGYENVFTYGNVSSLSVADALSLLKNTSPNAKPEGYIGKTVTDFVWKIAIPMSSADASSYRVGTTARLMFPSCDNAQYSATVVYSESFKGEALVIFEGVFGTELFAKERTVEVKILKSSLSVLSVPSSALLQNDNGVTGVYVLVGQQVVFKPVNFIKYEGNNAYITPVSASSSALSQYDEVIYSGKNLFDGKII